MSYGGYVRPVAEYRGYRGCRVSEKASNKR